MAESPDPMEYLDQSLRGMLLAGEQQGRRYQREEASMERADALRNETTQLRLAEQSLVLQRRKQDVEASRQDFNQFLSVMELEGQKFQRDLATIQVMQQWKERRDQAEADTLLQPLVTQMRNGGNAYETTQRYLELSASPYYSKLNPQVRAGIDQQWYTMASTMKLYDPYTGSLLNPMAAMSQLTNPDPNVSAGAAAAWTHAGVPISSLNLDPIRAAQASRLSALMQDNKLGPTGLRDYRDNKAMLAEMQAREQALEHMSKGRLREWRMMPAEALTSGRAGVPQEVVDYLTQDAPRQRELEMKVRNSEMVIRTTLGTTDRALSADPLRIVPADVISSVGPRVYGAIEAKYSDKLASQDPVERNKALADRAAEMLEAQGVMNAFAGSAADYTTSSRLGVSRQEKDHVDVADSLHKNLSAVSALAAKYNFKPVPPNLLFSSEELNRDAAVSLAVKKMRDGTSVDNPNPTYDIQIPVWTERYGSSMSLDDARNILNNPGAPAEERQAAQRGLDWASTRGLVNRVDAPDGTMTYMDTAEIKRKIDPKTGMPNWLVSLSNSLTYDQVSIPADRVFTEILHSTIKIPGRAADDIWSANDVLSNAGRLEAGTIQAMDAPAAAVSRYRRNRSVGARYDMPSVTDMSAASVLRSYALTAADPKTTASTRNAAINQFFEVKEKYDAWAKDQGLAVRPVSEYVREPQVASMFSMAAKSMLEALPETMATQKASRKAVLDELTQDVFGATYNTSPGNQTSTSAAGSDTVLPNDRPLIPM